MTGRIAGMAVAMWALWGCGLGVAGNGVIKDEAREVASFEAVRVGAGIEADVALGQGTSVIVRTDENLLPLITTEVKEGVLVVGTKAPGVAGTQNVRVFVVTPRLTAADSSGGAQVTAAASVAPDFTATASGGAKLSVCGIDSDRVVANSSGGATVSLCGKTRELVATASGGAGLLADGLTAESVHLDGSGGAHGVVLATTQVTGELSGGASFRLLGGPATNGVALSGGAVLTERP